MLDGIVATIDSAAFWLFIASLAYALFEGWRKLAKGMIEAQTFGYKFRFFGPIPKAKLVRSELSRRHEERMEEVRKACAAKRAEVEGAVDKAIKHTQDALLGRTSLEDLLKARREAEASEVLDALILARRESERN